jgi:hypothetical protein
LIAVPPEERLDWHQVRSVGKEHQQLRRTPYVCSLMMERIWGIFLYYRSYKICVCIYVYTYENADITIPSNTHLQQHTLMI